MAHCGLCNSGLGDEHQHLIEPTTRMLKCACNDCAILFTTGQPGARYRRIPRNYRWLSNFVLGDEEWDSLRIPIQLAFFFYSSSAKKVVAVYPGPAGPTESLLGLESWDEIVNANPILQKMDADVEALLVNRTGEKRDYYLVPIDTCYELVGLIRTYWKGLSGGSEVRIRIDQFFQQLREKSNPEVETKN